MALKDRQEDLETDTDGAYIEPTSVAVDHPAFSGELGTLFLHEPSYLLDVNGCTISLDGSDRLKLNQQGESNDGTSQQSSASAAAPGTEMNNQDRYIDARLAGIEGKLDARMDAMQRFQEKAEDRFQRATDQHERDVAAAKQQIQDEFKEARKHATQVAIGTIAGVLAAFALVVAVAVGWISDQGSYAKSYGENQVQMQQAAGERAEFRDAVKDIQLTQKSILDRLPEEQEPASSR